VLVVGAGLFIRTLARLTDVPLGFDSDRVLVVDVDATRTGVAPGERVSLYGRLVDAVTATPGVEHAAAALVTPVSGGFFALAVEGGGAREVPTTSRQVVGTFITPQWFASYDIPLRAGRDLEASDTTGAPLVAVVNEAFARALFPGGGALGQVVELSGGRGDIRLGRRTIVGVVGDSLSGPLRDGVKPTVYFPFTQWNAPLPVPSRVSISVRSLAPSVRPSQMVRSATTALTTVNSSLNVRVRQIGDELRASLAQERVIATLSGFFGAFALLLAGLGLYGVTAHRVARRRSELGVRLALGAPPGSLVILIARGLMQLVVVGLALGIGGGLALSRFVASLLYGVEPQDAMTFAAAAIVVALVAVVAASVPVLRSCRLDPGSVLREI
jgi:predicted permease